MIRLALVAPPPRYSRWFRPPQSYGGHVAPPQGLLHLAAVARKQGHVVSVIDAPAYGFGFNYTVKTIESLRPNCVGVTIYSSQVESTLALVGALASRLPGTRFVLGGPHASIDPEGLLNREPAVSAVVTGEGEQALSNILTRWDSGENDLDGIAGVTFRKSSKSAIVASHCEGHETDLDSLPDPAWDLLPGLTTRYRPSRESYLQLPAIGLVTSRGCPHTCVFCDRSVFGSKWRGFSAARVFSWLSLLADHFGIHDFHFEDDLFISDKARVRALSDAIRESGRDLRWSACTRADTVDSETLEAMSRSGCWQLAFGFESGSDQLLKLLQKRLDRTKIERAVRLTREAGIKVKGYFMIGLPGETLQTLRETEDFIRDLRLDYYSVRCFTPSPGTTAHQDYRLWGTMDAPLSRMSRWEPVFIPHGLSREDLYATLSRLSPELITRNTGGQA